MRHFLSVLSLLLILFSCTLSPTASNSTGHEGEAKIIGIAIAVDGTPLKNGELFIATPNYLPEMTRSAGGKEISTDSLGAFEIILTLGGEYVLSSQQGTDLMYRKFTASQSEQNLGLINYERGKDVVVNNSDEGIYYKSLFVFGTKWSFALEEGESSTIVLPEAELSILRKGVKSNSGGSSEDVSDSSTVDVIDSGTVIGDSTEIIPTIQRLDYTLSDTLLIKEPIIIDFSYENIWDSVIVEWEFDSTTLYTHPQSDTLYLGQDIGVHVVTFSQYQGNNRMSWQDSIHVITGP